MYDVEICLEPRSKLDRFKSSSLNTNIFRNIAIP